MSIGPQLDVCPTYLEAREPVVSSQGRQKTKPRLVGTNSYQTKIGPATHKNCHGTWIAQFQLIFCIVFSQKTPATRESAGAEFHREDAQHGPSVRVRRYTPLAGLLVENRDFPLNRRKDSGNAGTSEPDVTQVTMFARRTNGNNRVKAIRNRS